MKKYETSAKRKQIDEKVIERIKNSKQEFSELNTEWSWWPWPENKEETKY